MAPLQQAEDRRSENRVPCAFTLSVRDGAGDGGLASALDLSSSGMRFQTVGRAIAPGERLLVQFTVNARTYSFCGRSLRTCEPAPFTQEVAVVFQAMDRHTRARLAASLRTRRVKPFLKPPL